MKTINSIKFIGSIIAIAAFIMILKSCKKADIAPQDAATTRAAAINAIKAKYGDVSAGIVYNINKTATEYFYKDANGQRVSLHGAGGTNGPTPTPCTYDCSTAPNASWLFPTYVLDYVERFYKCESSSLPGDQKSEVNVKWTVSVPFNIAPASVGSTLSEGYVQFDDGTTITTFTAPYTQMTMTYIGPTPGCSTNNTYEVTYKVDNIPDSYFASGTTIAAAVDLANNCYLVYNIVSSGYVTGPTFSQDGYLPCNRIDKVYTSSIPATVPAIWNGNAVGTCTQPTGWQYIDYHQLEYRPVTVPGNYNWDDQTSSTIRWGTPSGGGATVPNFSPFDYVTLSNITTGSGWWLIRYRNVKTGSCNIINGSPAAPGQPWGNPALWITEAWQY